MLILTERVCILAIHDSATGNNSFDDTCFNKTLARVKVDMARSRDYHRNRWEAHNVCFFRSKTLMLRISIEQTKHSLLCRLAMHAVNY